MTYHYQALGSRFLASRRRALLADDMGLGKSKQVIDACDQLEAKRILVICPAVVRPAWKRQFELWQRQERSIRVLESRGLFPFRDGVTIASYELAQDVIDSLKPAGVDVLVLDEVHYLKNRKAKRTRTIYGQRCDGTGGLVSLADHVWGLSGTPAPNDPSELWPMMRALFPKTLPKDKFDRPLAYWAYVNRYCRTQLMAIGRMRIVGGKNLPELRQRLQPHMLRRLTADVLDDLPPWRFDDLPVQADDVAGIDWEDPRLEKLLKAIHDQDRKALKQLSLDFSTMRRLIGMAKARAVADLLNSEIDGGLHKIVLFAWHHDVINALVQRIQAHQPQVITGMTSPEEREAALKTFRKDARAKVFVGQIKAAGVGLDGLQEAANEVLFVESSWSPNDNMQAAKRAHRIGQVMPVRVRFASLAGSIDELISEALRRKTEMLTQLFECQDQEFELSLEDMLA